LLQSYKKLQDNNVFFTFKNLAL